jgi:hypothetical protein
MRLGSEPVGRWGIALLVVLGVAVCLTGVSHQRFALRR